MSIFPERGPIPASRFCKSENKFRAQAADAAALAHMGGAVTLPSLVGIHAAVKPLLSHSATGEFKSHPKYLRRPKKCLPLLYPSSTSPLPLLYPSSKASSTNISAP
eukprot:284412-Pyramimonas_sp.AAC.1